MFREKGECYLEPAEDTSWAALFRAGQYRDETATAVRLGSMRGKFVLTDKAQGGKTVLLSTLEALFRNGASAFEGLAAETLWKESGRYRVLTLDFGRLYVETDDESINIVAQGLRELLTENFSRLGIRVENGEGDWVSLLTQSLADAPLSSVVLLVDNLDRPYLEALSDSELLRNVDRHVSRFIEIVDSMSEKCRFVLMTRKTPLGPAGLSERGIRSVTFAELA